MTRTFAWIYLVMCLLTMLWMGACCAFYRTYFRRVHSAIVSGDADPYQVAISCGEQLMLDIVVPSVIMLAISLTLALDIAMSRSSKQSEEKIG